MRVVIAPDSFKGGLDAVSVAERIGAGIRGARPDVELILAPMADGGEGTLDVLVEAAGGQRRVVRASGPLGSPLEVPVGLVRQASTAVIESARVSGYALVAPDRRDPLRTTTYGLGEVIRVAIESGVEEIVLGLGDSATVDGGAGMMQALGLRYVDRAGRLIASPVGGGDLSRIDGLVWARPPEELDEVRFTIACDVLNPACGASGAAAVFAPQKGADAAGVRTLEAGLAHWAELLESACGRTVRDEPGTGAGGGIALPLLAFTQALLVPGVDLVIEAHGLLEAVAGAALVVTGEGRLDRQSMMGKVVGAVGRMARSAGAPCVAIVGAAGAGAEDCLAWIDRIYTLDCERERTGERLEEVAGRVAEEWFEL